MQFCCFRDAAAKLWIGANLKLDQRDSVEIDAPRCAPGKTVNLGRILVFAGLALAAGGLLVMLGAKLGLPRLGRLPGDLVFKGKNSVFYFPIVTSILLSVVLTLVFALFRRN